MKLFALASALLLALPIVTASNNTTADSFNVVWPCAVASSSVTLPLDACRVELVGTIRLVSCPGSACRVEVDATATYYGLLPGQVTLQIWREQSQISQVCASQAAAAGSQSLVATCNRTWSSVVVCGHHDIVARGGDLGTNTIGTVAVAGYGVCGNVNGQGFLVRER